MMLVKDRVSCIVWMPSISHKILYYLDCEHLKPKIDLAFLKTLAMRTKLLGLSAVLTSKAKYKLLQTQKPSSHFLKG